MTTLISSRPLLLIVLAPQPNAIAARAAARGKNAYGTWAIDQLDNVLRQHTPRIGLWLDTSHQTATQTVEEILARGWTEARIQERSRE
jgi:hypothetical protein